MWRRHFSPNEHAEKSKKLLPVAVGQLEFFCNMQEPLQQFPLRKRNKRQLCVASEMVVLGFF